MQSLHLETAHLAQGDFSVLPSPSTFFAGTSAFPGTPVVDYTLPSPSTAAFDYQAAFPAYSGQHYPSSASAASSPEHAWSSAASSDRASSPASSLHSTPRGSPVLDKAVVVPADEHQYAPNPYDRAMAADAAQDPLFMDTGKPILEPEPPSQHPLVPLDAVPAAFGSFPPAVDAHEGHADAASSDLMYAYAAAQQQLVQQPIGVGAQQQQHHFQVPSPAPSNASVGYQHAYLDPTAYQQQQAYASPQQPYGHVVAAADAGFTLGQYGVAAGQPSLAQQQQGLVPVQFTTLNGATYAVAVPVSAPAPAAIETPHGTYYFVPNPAPVVPSPAVQPQQQLSPAPAPVVPTPIPVVAANQEPAYVLPTGATVAASALPSAMAPQQKIRLPVGQGKRGSTKRPAKKDQPKRFICPHPGCGRAFARNFNMSSHYKSHLGVREFACHVCPKMFSRRHDRARHCAAVHDEHVDRDGNVEGAAAEDYDEHDEHAAFDPYAVDIGVSASGSG
ncbi:hypothetical protein JCM10450v2_006936 [Rhodotorula kratochvilovae]